MNLTTCPDCGMTLVPMVDGRIARHGNTVSGECRRGAPE